MADYNWQKVREIFDLALLRNGDERRSFVAGACGLDKALLAEVESLLASLDSADSFMETPAVVGAVSSYAEDRKRFAPGRRLGNYEIVRQVGSGGMGEVYLARDEKLDRQVAIKILSQEVRRQEPNLERFLREAKAASALNHPNILTIYEFGETEDAHFIVSEFIEGETLRERLRESRIDLTSVLDISIQKSKQIDLSWDNLITYHAALGEKDKAFELINKRLIRRVRPGALVDPRLDPLRDDPRFAELVKRINPGGREMQQQ